MSIADTVRVYLNSRPYTLISLESGIVNYSALSRLVCKELNIENYSAVKAGIRRYAKQAIKSRRDLELRARGIFEGNKITLLDGVSVVISHDRLNIKNDAEVRLGDYYAYFTDKNIAREIARRKKTGIIKIRESCSALIIYSGNRLENEVGALAFITSVLASQNINIIETVSCYDRTIFVVDKKDALRSYGLISEATQVH